MRDAAGALGVDPYSWILTGGDDHALAATFPAGTKLPADWWVIGAAGEGSSLAGDGLLVVGAPALKRMSTFPAGRGRGVAAALVRPLEVSAMAAGRKRVVLETG